MAIWDTLMGRKPTSSSSQPSPSTSSPPSDDLRDTAPTTSFDPSRFQVQDVSSILQGANIPDPAQLHPLAGLGASNLDYLTLDESTLSDIPGAHSGLPSRGWTDDLCYGTGITYVTALSAGGAWGFAEGLNRSPASAPPKLRLNSVLNSVTRRGPFMGNSAGVLALVYNLLNSTFGYWRGRHDAFNSVAAGAASGMLFKSTRGLRPMMISGALVAGAAGTWTVSSRRLKYVALILIVKQLAKKVLI